LSLYDTAFELSSNSGLQIISESTVTTSSRQSGLPSYPSKAATGIGFIR
jgi:hypothetical protein